MNAQTAARFAQANPATAKAGQEYIQTVIARSATDKAFRQLLLVDPHAAIADATGQTVPKNFRVSFVENTADATIVLPPVITESAELSEHELETVSGGTEAIAISLAIFAASMALSASIGREGPKN